MVGKQGSLADSHSSEISIKTAHLFLREGILVNVKKVRRLLRRFPLSLRGSGSARIAA